MEFARERDRERGGKCEREKSGVCKIIQNTMVVSFWVKTYKSPKRQKRKPT